MKNLYVCEMEDVRDGSVLTKKKMAYLWNLRLLCGKVTFNEVAVIFCLFSTLFNRYFKRKSMTYTWELPLYHIVGA